MAIQLTSEYIDNHMLKIHNYDSFGRALVEYLLNEAAKQTGTGAHNEIVLNEKIVISPVEALGCMKVVIGGVLVHVAV
ncbi:hypothetical protein [Paenibacillus polymyxa]|uniref:hypothetical protein n=1 Tax=Paenibacillus polymyxa TaxID=1406 RepID=UPI0005CEA78D|nr:hypothetical protein [Paenibacillus polymyxa]KJD38051.1 hypothetical protein QD46_21220 [Paenibacillus polymyxa]MBY7740228.1 hypothetical protein [Paenibacillus polymyxa]MEE4581054.1 hypothetical protein [Paenibacillus polymyxa]